MLLELLEWVHHAPEVDEVLIMGLDERLRTQRLCVINQLVQTCLQAGIQLSSESVQNGPLIVHASNQLTEFMEEALYGAAEGLARELAAVMMDAQLVIPEIEDLLEY